MSVDNWEGEAVKDVKTDENHGEKKRSIISWGLNRDACEKLNDC